MNIEQATLAMEQYIAAFPENIKDALDIGKKAAASFKTGNVKNVLISGLGGSGIGGKIISQLVWDSCKVPVALVHDYNIPAWVDQNTLFIACSYSGNTEETISTFEEALVRKAEIACITSGGKLRSEAVNRGLNLIEIPSGQPPRTSFGFNALQVFFILGAYGLIPQGFEDDLLGASELLRKSQGTIRAEAAAIANKIKGTTPVIYSSTWFEGVAIRLRQQINENAKMLCWHHALPEMNHNELVAWAGGNPSFSVLMMRTPEDHPGTTRRMDLSKEIISRYTSNIVELHPRGHNRIANAYYLIHFSDWISYYMAVDRGVDPIEINVIDYFKSELSKG